MSGHVDAPVPFPAPTTPVSVSLVFMGPQGQMAVVQAPYYTSQRISAVTMLPAGQEAPTWTLAPRDDGTGLLLEQDGWYLTDKITLLEYGSGATLSTDPAAAASLSLLDLHGDGSVSLGMVTSPGRVFGGVQGPLDPTVSATWIRPVPPPQPAPDGSVDVLYDSFEAPLFMPSPDQRAS